ncbi:MAG: cytochrome c-550 PedF [Rhodocyclaceae bacterium]
MKISRLLSVALTLFAATAAMANELPVPVSVDLGDLPRLGETWLPGNPYRGNPRAVTVGDSAFQQACARCHGADANPSGSLPAPDLRQLNRSCRPIADAVLKARCMADNDQFFSKSVREGKVVVGVVHMPRWQETMSQETIWAIQTYIESRVPVGVR